MRILVAVLFVVVGASVGIYRFRKRIERGTRAKAQAKSAQARALLEGRLTAEAQYVLHCLESEERSPQPLDPGDPGTVRRVEEIRQTLARTFAPTPTSLPVSGPCAEVIDSFRARVGDRDLLYSESGDGRWLHAFGDRELLRWVVQELFANVIQHAGDWTRISVLAEPANRSVVLTVRDDGRGLTPSLAARLYSPFTPRPGSDGVGLGLYVVRRIVETMGGTIEARSSEGQGLLHRIRLPVPAGGPYGDAAARESRSRVIS